MGNQRYTAYLNSARWREKRRLALAGAGQRCQKCGFAPAQGKGLHVHHKTYVNFGDELMSDLQVLCEPCHNEVHGAKKNPYLWSGKRYSVRKRALYEVFDRKTRKVLGKLKTKALAVDFAMGADSTVSDFTPDFGDRARSKRKKGKKKRKR